MRALATTGIVLGLILSLLSQAPIAEGDTTSDSSQLTLSLMAHKRRFKPKEQVKFDIMVTNSGKEPVYIFGTLGVGYSASLIVHVRNAAGKDVQPLFDDLTFESPNDKSVFVKLLPYHFLGKIFSRRPTS